jgi:surface polysaccharide O-acyltransferase-like enzyme
MPSARRHDIDALRVLLFATLILYHCAMLYVADWSFHLKSSYQTTALQIPMLLVNRWRMPLLFLISGLALNFLHRDLSGWRLAANRTRRILMPLVFGIVVVVPIQPYCEGVTRHLVDPGFGRFLVHYYSFQPWPKDAFTGSNYAFTWNHLWYLAYVWVYSLVLTALMPVLESRPGLAVRRAVTGLRGGALLLVPAIPKAVALIALADAFPPTNDLVVDWYQHLLYFSYFLLGWWIATDHGLWAELRALRYRTLGLTLFVFPAYIAISQYLLTDDSDGWPLLLGRCVSGLNTWLWIATVLGWSATLLDRPFRWLPYATEAVLPWYVLHQSLIIAIAYLVVPLRIGAVLEPVVVIVGTIVGCAVLHEALIRRSALLRPLFGVKPTAGARHDRGMIAAGRATRAPRGSA